MDEETEREHVLAAVDPVALFGAAAQDPRELRRAYATLARTWREDAEVSARIRALFEQARDAAPVPTAPLAEESPAPLGPIEQLAQSMGENHLQAIYDVVLDAHKRIAEERPQLLRDALSRLILGYGERLAPDVCVRLGLILDDPGWEPGPALEWSLHSALQVLRDLHRARAEEALPVALLDGLLATWGHRPPGLIAAWEQTARALEGVDLDGLFADLEQDWPALLGWIAKLENELLDHTTELPALAPPEDLRAAYVLTGAEIERRHAKAHSYPVQLAWGSALLVGALAVGIRGLWVGVVVYGLRFVVHSLLPFALGWRNRRDQARLARMPREPLLTRAREEGWLPRELLGSLFLEAEALRDDPLFKKGDVLLELDRDPTALLRVLGERHVARFQEAPS